MYGRPQLADFLLHKMKEYKNQRRKHPDWLSLRSLLLYEGLDVEKGATLQQQANYIASQLPIDTEENLLSMDPEARQEYSLGSFLDENRPE